MKNYKRWHTRDELIFNGIQGITSIFQRHTVNWLKNKLLWSRPSRTLHKKFRITEGQAWTVHIQTCGLSGRCRVIRSAFWGACHCLSLALELGLRCLRICLDVLRVYTSCVQPCLHIWWSGHQAKTLVLHCSILTSSCSAGSRCVFCYPVSIHKSNRLLLGECLY